MCCGQGVLFVQSVLLHELDLLVRIDQPVQTAAASKFHDDDGRDDEDSEYCKDYEHDVLYLAGALLRI